MFQDNAGCQYNGSRVRGFCVISWGVSTEIYIFVSFAPRFKISTLVDIFSRSFCSLDCLLIYLSTSYHLPQSPPHALNMASTFVDVLPPSLIRSLGNISNYLSTSYYLTPSRPHEVSITSTILSLKFTTFVTFLLGTLALVLKLTRIITGREHAPLQNETATEEKDVPVLPYWLPYVGHALHYAWSFDDLATWGR